MYTPTEQELLEMGFVKNIAKDFEKEIGIYFCHKCGITYAPVFFRHYYDYCNGFCVYEDYTYYNEDGGQEDRTCTELFPRSKEHLEQIILAFKP